MALISFGTIVTNMRGKVGGSVFSANSAGATVRNKTIPKRRTTDIKSATNNLWQYFMQVWLTLSASDQDDWNAYALNFTFHNKLGVPVLAKGNVVFAATNFYYFTFNEVPLLVAPLYVPPPAASLSASGCNVGSMLFELIFTPLVADTIFWIYATPSYTKNNRIFNEKRVRYIGFKTVALGDDTVSFWSEYVARFGTPIVGQKILVAWRRMDFTGWAWSPMQYIEVKATA